jgi:hypothetical protein
MPFDSSNDNQYFQGVWARMFGQFIQSGREKAGLAVEPAAWLADIDPQQWSAMEAGDWLPTTRQQFQLIAAALDIQWETMSRMVAMCSQAWGIR